MIAIRHFFLCAAMLCLLGSFAKADTVNEPGERERQFLRALDSFDRAKSPEEYNESAKQFEALLVDGFQNGAIYYNLGNAYYRAGQFGRAIINYRKAKLFRPSDSYLEANLQQALAKAPGRLAEATVPWWKHVFFWSDWIAQSTKIALATLGLSLAAAIVFIASWLRQQRLNWIVGPMAFVSLPVFFDACLNDPTMTRVAHAVIISETVARKGTGDDYEAAFDKPLQDGAEFQILSETANWTLGHFEGIGDGWVRNENRAK